MKNSLAVVVRLMGGLGNQMFQYATARAVALYKGVPLKLDLSWFQNQTKREYELHHLRIPGQFASNQPRLIEKLLGHAVQTLLPRYRQAVYRQGGQAFDPKVFSTRSDVLLVGYWQSERYFSHIRETLLEEFAVASDLQAKTVDTAKSIATVNAVSLHVRRGDYVSEPRTREMHGVCPPDYYLSAVRFIADRVKEPHFFVFSDDIEWARINLQIDFPATFVDHTDPDRGYEDLYLMRQCQHHVVANSSFSWWGAWLCDSPSKIVTAPRRWFSDPKIQEGDIVPEGWLRF